ncbi:MAG: DMT family transporter [Lachnospiraceae bacterium]|nr:DMT family transporter [Lachnospiraceae bacterium]
MQHNNTKIKAVIFALLAAVFYAINTPVSKLLLQQVDPAVVAAFLYLGAGVGVGIMYLFHYRKEAPEERLKKTDFPYTLGMILLDIAAPVLLMMGISIGSASDASLLGNFEIVATTLMALLLFKERVSGRLWLAIGFITVSSILLSLDGAAGFRFSTGSLFVILATCCWGLENNCTRKISDKSTYQIVVLKGFLSGGGALILALAGGGRIPALIYMAAAMLLGFVSYGLSIFLYIRAQSTLGAAKTSAYYAVAPFVGAFLAVIVNKEQLTGFFYVALLFMLAGSVMVVYDTMVRHHVHAHSHLIVHRHNGRVHTHFLMHQHDHEHLISEGNHGHRHESYRFSKEHTMAHKQ